MHAGTLGTQSFFGSEFATAEMHEVPRLSATRHEPHTTDAQTEPLCAGWQLLLVHWLSVVQAVPLTNFAWHTLSPVLHQ